MSELFNQEEVVQEQQAVQTEEAPVELEAMGTEEVVAVPEVKPNKKKLILIIAAAAVVVIAVLLVAILHKSKFEKVKDECVQIAGMVSSGKDYFKLDTYPDIYEEMDPAVAALLAPGAQENALEAIQYANEELGFSDAVYDQMLHTSALMGRQSAENDKYRVSWTYHPDDGLEVTYEKK